MPRSNSQYSSPPPQSSSSNIPISQAYPPRPRLSHSGFTTTLASTTALSPSSSTETLVPTPDYSPSTPLLSSSIPAPLVSSNDEVALLPPNSEAALLPSNNENAYSNEAHLLSSYIPDPFFFSNTTTSFSSNNEAALLPSNNENAYNNEALLLTSFIPDPFFFSNTTTHLSSSNEAPALPSSTNTPFFFSTTRTRTPPPPSDLAALRARALSLWSEITQLEETIDQREQRLENITTYRSRIHSTPFLTLGPGHRFSRSADSDFHARRSRISGVDFGEEEQEEEEQEQGRGYIWNGRYYTRSALLEELEGERERMRSRGNERRDSVSER
ncbi:hypothetical protein EJ04DRAFT_553332 [Polyplosphaeria fusca]|uniref:Uncharacterized protein n=1 Tax=Polyplosphaeria fusca TaxID=682080 RepID=A0A9P4QYQ1_9PLEO|nr:hypothetical protein EJ04DRAFT_553332 [Polyplosphaeria fusca]